MTARLPETSRRRRVRAHRAPDRDDGAHGRDRRARRRIRTSIVSLRHSASEGTAITLADRQLETYRSMPFACIPDTTFAEPAGCGTYSGFPNPYPTAGCSPLTTGCATQVTTSTESPDHRIYKVTTVVSSASGSARQINVTVALNSGGPVLAQRDELLLVGRHVELTRRPAPVAVGALGCETQLNCPTDRGLGGPLG